MVGSRRFPEVRDASTVLAITFAHCAPAVIPGASRYRLDRAVRLIDRAGATQICAQPAER
jgi:hypothetical protein